MGHKSIILQVLPSMNESAEIKGYEVVTKDDSIGF